MHQPNFFSKPDKAEALKAEQVILVALGEFQARGKVLADRELPLDRLLGALRRAADGLDVEVLNDDQVAATLTALGAIVRQIPSFVAKHPYRVTVQPKLAERSLDAYREFVSQTKEVIDASC